MEETNQKPLAVKVLAELAGSFLLCFALYLFGTCVAAIFGLNIVFAALATGIAYALISALFAKISGGQLNPAITVAAILTSKTKILDGILYIVAQVVGAIIAAFVVVALLPTSDNVPLKTWLTPAVNGYNEGSLTYSTLQNYGITYSVVIAIIVELVAGLIIVGTAISTMGEHGESSDRHVVLTGLAYALGAAMTYPITGAALNPARATGIAIAAQGKSLTTEPLGQLWVFWLCPILAAALIALGVIVAQILGSKLSGKADDADAADETAEDAVVDAPAAIAQTKASVKKNTKATAKKIAQAEKQTAAAIKNDEKKAAAAIEADEKAAGQKIKEAKAAAKDAKNAADKSEDEFANEVLDYLNNNTTKEQ